MGRGLGDTRLLSDLSPHSQHDWATALPWALNTGLQSGKALCREHQASFQGSPLLEWAKDLVWGLLSNLQPDLGQTQAGVVGKTAALLHDKGWPCWRALEHHTKSCNPLWLFSLAPD